MPQNTPMKRQFTTIDGRTVMSNLPQHWGGNDWKITGVDNPLPVGNYVQTEAGVWIPQKGSDDGAADVRLTGSYVEYRAARRNFSITAGARKEIRFIFDKNIEAFAITLYKHQTHTTSKPMYMFRFGDYSAPAFLIELPLLNEDTSRGFTSKKIDVLHDQAIMVLSNNDTSDQNYSIFVTLFKKSLDGSVTISEAN